jgi:outer membrane receptor protein involved in Fe transport
MQQRKLPPALAATALAMTFFTPAPATAEEANDNTPAALAPVTIIGRGQDMIGLADSATEGKVSAQQLANRPLLRPAEVLETVPGMTVTQHSGDGKANQYFLRGFNLDHGSDFASYVNGMPVNMASHAHGQGYMDLNFLIPELIGAMRYRKGVYAAEDGDFATTGSARIEYQRALPAPMIDLSVGPHDFRRVLAAGSRQLGQEKPGQDKDSGPTLLAAFEAATNDGPWQQPERLRKVNGVLRLSEGTARDGYALTAMAYHAEWTATEHVPERAISAGEIDRFGELVPSDGGRTHRHSLSADWAGSDGNTQTQASAYVIDYGLNLFSNPSGYLSGPQGDQHEQADERTVWGGQVARHWAIAPAGRETELTLGAQLRHDRIGTLGLYSTVNRERTTTVREDRVRETLLGLYTEARTQWRPWLRSDLGLRVDTVRANVTPTGGDDKVQNGDSARAHQVSPKLGLAFGPFGETMRTELYADWGRGFHSNDVRGVTAAVDPVPALVRATGSEIGLRAVPLPGWNTSLSLWQVTLASELVFVGDAGVTEPKGASKRAGIEWSNDWQINRWLLLDADVAWSRARFEQEAEPGSGTHVPNAIPRSASFVLAADDHGAWFGGLRWRYIGSYALEETGTQRSAALWTANLKAGWRASPSLQFTLDVLNLFDREAYDIEYWGAACSKADGPACNGGAGIDGRLVHPMEPRTVRVSMRATF